MSQKALELMKTALDMETRGRTFYESAAKKCTHQLGKETFEMLMKDETAHMDRIKKIYASLEKGNNWTHEWESIKAQAPGNLNKLFKGWALKHDKAERASAGDIEALDVGIDLESKAVAFYTKELAAATDPEEKKFAELMIHEEKHHHLLLTDMRLYLTDPSAWYTENEHHAMDGV